MTIKIIKKKTPMTEVERLAEETFGEMAKGVVDITKKVMALGGELHADSEAVLLEKGSKQRDLWGINIYPQKSKEERIEFSSLINIRPTQGNRSLDIKDENLRKQIRQIVDSLIE